MVSFHLLLPGMHTLEHNFISEQKLTTHVHVQNETSQFLSPPSPAGWGERGGGIVVK